MLLITLTVNITLNCCITSKNVKIMYTFERNALSANEMPCKNNFCDCTSKNESGTP